MKFTAIDFETAVGQDTACAIGMVMVDNGRIVDQFYQLIQPPGNKYTWRTTQVHGLSSRDTCDKPLLPAIFPEIKKRLIGRTLVAHNEAFDRNVLRKSIGYYGMDYDSLGLPRRWECTVKIYRSKGFSPCSLNVLCNQFGIELDPPSSHVGCTRLCSTLFEAFSGWAIMILKSTFKHRKNESTLSH